MSDPAPEKKSPQIEQAGASDDRIQEVHSILLREKPEPTESPLPLPLFMIGGIAAVIFMVGIYFVHYSGGFSPMVYDERFDPKNAPAVGQEVKLDPVTQGKKLYASVCAACHQPTGLGMPGVYPPLAKSEWVAGSEERVIRILLHGLNGPVKAAGVEINSSMPVIGPGGYNFTDEKIAAVLTYVRQEWGNSAPPVTAEKVKEIRTQSAAGRSTPWTAAELEAIK